MSSRRKKQSRSNKPLAASQDARPPVAALCKNPTFSRSLLLGAMTALFVARPLFPSEAVATHGDGVSVVMLWIALAAFWLIAAIARPNSLLKKSGSGNMGATAGLSSSVFPEKATRTAGQASSGTLFQQAAKNSPCPPGDGPGVRVRFGWIETAVVVFLLFIAAAHILGRRPRQSSPGHKRILGMVRPGIMFPARAAIDRNRAGGSRVGRRNDRCRRGGFQLWPLSTGV